MSKVVRLPVGRRERSKAQNRQAILAAGRDLFGELGFEACTVRLIIRRAGLATGTFYNYYRSKEEVYAALSQEGTRKFSPLLKDLRSQSADWQSFLRAAIRAYFEFAASEHQAWTGQQPPEQSPPRGQGENPEITAVFHEVRQAIVDEITGENPFGVDPDYLATACIAIARDVGQLMIARRPVDTEAAADFVVRLIMDGVVGLAAPRP